MLLCSTAFANEGGSSGGAADSLALEPLTVNLGSGHYIQFKAHLKLKDAKDQDRVKSYMPVVRFELIKSILGKDPAEVQTPKFINEYSASAAGVINKALEDEYIKELFFETWLIQ